jgi:hypothetical protein
VPRYYVVQYCHRTRGWTDLPLASFKQKKCQDAAEEFASTHRVVTRVIRKPKGWVPPSFIEEEPPPEPEVALPEPKEWEDDPEELQALKTLRKQEKRRSRAQAAYLRKPTIWDRLLDED